MLRFAESIFWTASFCIYGQRLTAWWGNFHTCRIQNICKHFASFCPILLHSFLMSGCYKLHTGREKGSLLHLHHSGGGRGSAWMRCWEQTVKAPKLPNFESKMTSCCSSSLRTRSLHNTCYKINSIYSVSWTSYFKLWHMEQKHDQGLGN